ncbi:Septum formation initiator [Denitrovibrio acetiphilus DSM 12809]|uniref:Septum formation initiator n=1 Tax=Denitrovibrio acetiphilus (strain DSM 12809 / NBRC 114555 / N2460) TaxID=522772 RepID=D4H0L4_DENA2|nr:septum formation initiator family protein [Denitrovibrio acetiphilus]ADD68527.1 Septum formation initiator [Denitrovibrio acetiphilus DSM 12809]
MKVNIVFLIVIAVLAAYMIFGHNGLLKYRELVRIKNNYELQLHVTEKKVNDLDNELKQVRKNVEYLEMVIKKELSLKKPDEDLYIIEDPKDTPEGTPEKNK